MRFIGRLRSAAARRWAAFLMDPWNRQSAVSPFEFDWLAD
jgi:hypothetical protein